MILPAHDTLSPVERALAVYDREPCARPFVEDLEAHLLNGFVISTPDVFLMFRPVPSEADPMDIINPFISYPRDRCDAFHVWLAAGKLSGIENHLPWPAFWICYERRNVLKWRRADQFFRHLSNLTLPLP